MQQKQHLVVEITEAGFPFFFVGGGGDWIHSETNKKQAPIPHQFGDPPRTDSFLIIHH